MLDPKDRVSFGGSNGRGDAPEDNPAHYLHDLLTQVGVLGEYAIDFVLAKLDTAKVRIRHFVLVITLGIVALLLACAVAVVCAAYVVAGVAGGLAAGLEIPAWLSQLLTGFLGLALPAALLGLFWRSSEAKRRDQKVNKYEHRKAKRRSKLARASEETTREAA